MDADLDERILKLRSDEDYSGQVHMSAAYHVGQNSSAHVVRSAQMYQIAVRLN